MKSVLINGEGQKAGRVIGDRKAVMPRYTGWLLATALLGPVGAAAAGPPETVRSNGVSHELLYYWWIPMPRWDYQPLMTAGHRFVIGGP